MRLAIRRSAPVALLLSLLIVSVPVAPPAIAASSEGCSIPLTRANRPVARRSIPSERATFIDPTAVVRRGSDARVGEKVYIAPFARLDARGHDICIEGATNVQDNTRLLARSGPIHVGQHAIVAHNASLIATEGPVSMGVLDACPLPEPGADPNAIGDPQERGRQALANALAEAGAHYECDEVPSFIGFNALNESAIGDGALLSVTSRIAPGVVLHPGYSTFPGKSLDTQAEAEDPSMGKVRLVNAGDIVFMEAVLHVNECLARGYTEMFRLLPSSVRGINWDPGAFHGCEFNRSTEAPVIDGEVVVDPDPAIDVRIIGDAEIGDIDGISAKTSIRADEGEPFHMGHGISWQPGSTFHALEPTAEDAEVGVTIGDDVTIGRRAVVHGGGRRPRAGGPGNEPTTIGSGSMIGDLAVVFRSDLFPNTIVGRKAVLVAYDTSTSGENIPDGCVKFSDTPQDECAYIVEW